MSGAFQPNQREALATIVQQTSAEPPVYLVELLFSFKGVKRLEVPPERIRPQSRDDGFIRVSFAKTSSGRQVADLLPLLLTQSRLDDHSPTGADRWLCSTGKISSSARRMVVVELERLSVQPHARLHRNGVGDGSVA